MGYMAQPEASGESTRYTYRGCFLSVIWIVVGIAVLASLIVFQLDSSCRATSLAALPDYPGATLVYEEYSLLRPWGIGETYRVLRSGDSLNDIRNWYIQNSDTPVQSGRPIGVDNALLFWFVRPDGDQSRIVLGSACGQSFSPDWQER